MKELMKKTEEEIMKKWKVKNTDNPVVSISCITYNHEKYIAEAIESFLVQETDFPFEILIHDDASTDKTADIIREYEKKYPKFIKPIYQKKNQYSKGNKRITQLYNHPRANGKYIALCEGDDYWSKSYKLQKQVDYMEANSECGMCFHAGEKVRAKDKKKSGVVRPYKKDCISSTEDIIMGDGGFISTNSIMYRKETMDNPPEFFFDAPVGDYPLQILTSLKNYAYYIDDEMSAYRFMSENSWTRKNSINYNKKIEISLSKIKMLKKIDEFTIHKYNMEIIQLMEIINFNVLLYKNDYKKIIIQDFYRNLSFIKKIKIKFRFYFPDLFLILKKQRNRFR